MINPVQATTGSNVVNFERSAAVAAVGTATTGAAVRDDRFEPGPVVAAVATMAVPEVRPEKVAELRAAIASGDYKVSASKLADALIAARALWS